MGGGGARGGGGAACVGVGPARGRGRWGRPPRPRRARPSPSLAAAAWRGPAAPARAAAVAGAARQQGQRRRPRVLGARPAERARRGRRADSLCKPVACSGGGGRRRGRARTPPPGRRRHQRPPPPPPRRSPPLRGHRARALPTRPVEAKKNGPLLGCVLATSGGIAIPRQRQQTPPSARRTRRGAADWLLSWACRRATAIAVFNSTRGHPRRRYSSGSPWWGGGRGRRMRVELPTRCAACTEGCLEEWGGRGLEFLPPTSFPPLPPHFGGPSGSARTVCCPPAPPIGRDGGPPLWRACNLQASPPRGAPRPGQPRGPGHGAEHHEIQRRTPVTAESP